MPGKPPDLYGRTWTDEYRLRPAFFGAALEQLVQEPDGSRRWVKALRPVALSPLPQRKG